MSSTRYSQQPLQIYQDPITSFDHAPMHSSQSSNTLPKKSPLRPIKNAASRRNIVFNPPQAGPSKQSPLKSSQHSSSPSRAPFNNKLNMVSMPPPGGIHYDTDSMEKKQPMMSKFKPQKALFTTFSSSQKGLEKENYPETYYEAPPAPYVQGIHRNNFSLEGLYGQKPPLKRTLMEAAPIHESRPVKKNKHEEYGDETAEMLELPAPESFPPLHDDGSKPSHSYAQLIGMSILRAPNRRLTLAQIYKWISDTYTFYSATDAGWQNSIRHNLSLNKAFIKQERPKDDPGKGNYWAIQPGMEHQFIKDKSTRKPAGPNENVPILSTNLAPLNQNEPSRALFSIPVPQIQQELPPQASYTRPESPRLPAAQEPSSDATIPASDVTHEAAAEDETEEAPPSSPLLHSSPPTALMRSSPPIARHVSRRQDTPPPVPRFPSSSRSRSHKRKFASMDDSGYFSSLDSSAMRRNPNRLLTSEADRPRIKRGRAEEEIARLRGSSYDSPTKTRALFSQPSSSPLRRSLKKPALQMLPPLTPAVKLKAPVRPPPSVSPNTNLRLHRDRVREMVGSPLRGMTCLDESIIPWSPAFNLENSPFVFHDLNPDLDIWNDSEFLAIPGNGSPEKKSAKRPQLNRSRSANILADISNSSHSNIKSVTTTPLIKFTPSIPQSGAFSPTKSLSGFFDSPNLGNESPSKMASPAFSLGAFDLQDQDFFGAEFLEDVSGFEGVDIMQGFQKIGAGANGGLSGRSTPRPSGSTRPGMGRSFSTRF